MNTPLTQGSITAILALPFLLAIMWVLGVVCFGLGLLLPYMFLSEETAFGFWRVALIGTLFNLFVAFMCVLLVGLVERLEIDIDRLYWAALIEMVLIATYAAGKAQGFSW